MSPNGTTYNIGKYSAAAVIIFLGAAGLYAVHRGYELPSGSTPAPTSPTNAGVLPDIPTPSGWDAERIDASRVVFTRRDNTARIDVDAFKSKTNIVDEIQSLGEDHTFDSSKTWSSENGRLILATPQQEGNGSIFTYYVLGQNQTYIFAFTPYRFYDPGRKTWITPDPSDLPAIKQMVQEFAKDAT